MKYLLLILLFILSSNLSAQRTWELVKSRIGLEEIEAIMCYDSTNCFAFSDGSFLASYFKTEDQGETWYNIYEKDFLATNDSLFSVFNAYMLDSNYIYYTMWDRAILEKSTDGGITFKRVTFGDLSGSENILIWDLEMYDRNLGVAVTWFELILTRDNWKTYERVLKDSSLTALGDVIFFIDSNNVAVTKSFRNGYDFMKYDIKKDEWSQYTYGEAYGNGIADKQLTDFTFVNDTLGYACGGKDTTTGISDILWKTTNRGKNWEILLDYPRTPKFGLTSIDFRTAEHGIAVGGWGKIMETTDGGKSWTYLESHPEISGPGMKVEWAGEYALVVDCCSGIYRLPPWVLSVNRNISNNKKIKIRQSENKLLVSIADKQYRKHQIQIYDIMGNKIQEQELSSGFGTLFQPILINKLQSGAYLFRIIVQGKTIHTGKFIK